MDSDETRERAGSTCSSRSRDSASSWTLLNAQGSDTETAANGAEKEGDGGSFEFEAVEMHRGNENGSVAGDSEDDEEVADVAEEAEEDLDSTLSAEESAMLRNDPTIDVSDGDDEVDHVPSEEEGDDDDLSIVDENEGLEDPSARMYVDATQVTRLLDALSAHQSTACYGDDLPANFVHMCSNRIKNYMHRSNARLNSKLTVLLVVVTAIVVGVGIGHFIGTTHSWLKRNRLANEQVDELKTLQDNLVSCLGQLEHSDAMTCWSRPDLQYQAASAQHRAEGTCQAAENPSCRANLVKCEQQLYDARSDFWRKSAVHRYIMHAANHQQQQFRRNNENNATDHMAALFWRAIRKQRRAERHLDAVLHRLRHQTAELNLQRAMSQRMMSVETAFKQQITQTQSDKERAMQSLRESSENVRHLQESLSSCRRDLGSKSTTNWQSPSLDDIFDHLQTANLSETLAAYLNFARQRLVSDSMWTIGEQNGQIVLEQLDQIRNVFDRLQLAARERLNNLRTLASAKDLSQYYDDARALSVQMGTALTRVWRETKQVAQTVVRDFTDEQTREQVVEIVRDLGRSAERLRAEVEESLPDAIQEGWTAISARIQSTFDSILSFDRTEEEEEGANCERMGLMENLENMAQTPRPTPDDQRTCEGLRLFGRALDGAKLGNIVGKHAVRRFIDGRLFSFPCTLPSVAQLHFLACQKCWWMADCVGLADPSRCDWEDWQKSYRLDAQRLYRDQPEVLRILVDVLRWQPPRPSSFDDEPPCLIKDTRGYCEARIDHPSEDVDVRPTEPSTDWLFNRDSIRRAERLMEERAEWQFQRSAGRDDQRRKMRSGYERAEWLFQRGKERAQHRREHAEKQSDDDDSDDDDDDEYDHPDPEWLDNLLKRKKFDRKDHKEAKRQQRRREKLRQHQFRHQSMFGGVRFDL